MIAAYHFTGGRLRDGRPVPPVGEWLTHTGPVEMCEAGLHASRHPVDALRYAPGLTLHRVEVADIVEEQADKLVCRRRRILATVDATRLLRRYACECAALACRCEGHAARESRRVGRRVGRRASRGPRLRASATRRARRRGLRGVVMIAFQ